MEASHQHQFMTQFNFTSQSNVLTYQYDTNLHANPTSPPFDFGNPEFSPLCAFAKSWSDLCQIRTLLNVIQPPGNPQGLL